MAGKSNDVLCSGYDLNKVIHADGSLLIPLWVTVGRRC